MANWTNEQKEAITLDGKNIIVSAGAGSGKTMVLTERVIRKLESGVSIQKLLILTFTKLAANEMKNRIRDAIKKRSELSQELKKLESSYITTFDSFSLSLVKKYHYLLNVKKNVNIIDGNLLSIKTKEYLDTVLEEEYHNREEDFVKLIDDFCLKDDNNIKKVILSVNRELDLKYDKETYLDNYINNYYSDEVIENNVLKYVDYLKSIISEIDSELTMISNLADDNYYHSLVDLIVPVITSTTYESINKNVNSIIKLPSLPRGSSDELKNVKESLNNKIKLLKGLTKFKDTNELLDSIKVTKPYIEAIIRIIKKLDEKINEYKFNNDLYDFTDICKMAIKLVKDNKNICEEVKNSFNEIMIDEYQDTSDLQEEFISLISNNNVYAVGDVKQSIYRFRNANPDIFREKYNTYAKGINGIKIDLLKNFRSREEVLGNINLIFNFVMGELIGGADYVKDHQMIAGNMVYSNEAKNEANNNIDIYSYDYVKELGFTREEIEAFIIAKDINNKVINHYQVFDKNLGKLRDARYSDFAILIDRSGSFDVFKKIFLFKQIPLSIYKDEYLNNSSLFLVIRNIFKLINLIYDKKYNELAYPYLSIGRSFLCDYDDNELFKTVIDNSYEKTDIVIKVNRIINNISSKSIRMILDEIVNEFDIYNKLRKVPNIFSNYINLDYLYSLSDNLNKMGYTFKDFDTYLTDILENDSDIRFSINKEDGESVKIMTIHASKGLEYPICYFPGLYKAFNEQDIKSSIIFNNKLGIITPYYDNGIDNTFYYELFKNNYYQDEISEKIRLFYVALTRVREKIILVIPNTEGEEEYSNDKVLDSVKMKYRSFLDIINSIKSKLTDYLINIDLNDIGLDKNYNLINSKNLFKNSSKLDNKISIMDLPKIVSISKEESHFSKSSSKLFSCDEKSKMDFGTKMHYYLETLDLKKPSLDDIESPYKEKVQAFLNSDLLKDLTKAKIYQEYEFMESDDIEEKHGIIDLMIDYGDYIDIIDYKLKNIRDEAYYKQLSGYKNYIEKISNKPVNIYLYSLINEDYQKIEIQ